MLECLLLQRLNFFCSPIHLYLSIYYPPSMGCCSSLHPYLSPIQPSYSTLFIFKSIISSSSWSGLIRVASALCCFPKCVWGRFHRLRWLFSPTIGAVFHLFPRHLMSPTFFLAVSRVSNHFSSSVIRCTYFSVWKIAPAFFTSSIHDLSAFLTSPSRSSICPPIHQPIINESIHSS